MLYAYIYIIYIYIYVHIYIYICVCMHTLHWSIAYHFIDIKNQPITCFLALTGIYHINPLSLYVTLGLTMSHYADTLVQNKRLKPHVCLWTHRGKKTVSTFRSAPKIAAGMAPWKSCHVSSFTWAMRRRTYRSDRNAGDWWFLDHGSVDVRKTLNRHWWSESIAFPFEKWFSFWGLSDPYRSDIVNFW